MTQNSPKLTKSFDIARTQLVKSSPIMLKSSPKLLKVPKVVKNFPNNVKKFPKDLRKFPKDFKKFHKFVKELSKVVRKFHPKSCSRANLSKMNQNETKWPKIWRSRPR